VHISISVSLRLTKKIKLFPLDYTTEPPIIRTEDELIEEKKKSREREHRQRKFHTGELPVWVFLRSPGAAWAAFRLGGEDW